jgi:superfamily II DNA or RNA helicase
MADQSTRNQFLTNYTTETFLDHIKADLRTCDSFCLSVSFIKKAGLVLLARDIEAAVDRGAVGRIITSTYQNFTDIESLRTFHAIMSKHLGDGRFECHLDYEDFHDEQYQTLGYHSKGYIFTWGNDCEIIVGSSNITRFALLKNIEWDVVVRESKDSEIYRQIMDEFDEKWTATEPLQTELLKKYETRLNYAIERWDMDYNLPVIEIKPNYMQRRALKELNRYRVMGMSKALVVAAAGSGKTYLAAFDALNFCPKKLLYIVGEGSILNKSLQTFQEVFGNSVTYGMYCQGYAEREADFLFASNVMMSRDKELFAPDAFDYVIIDECHHSVANTYRSIIEYFKPEFLLGLTATPERMDNQDVFELFDTNVPYELRLRDAIINDLIVPFKYYGIRDNMVDYGLTKSEERKLVEQLSNVDHCDFVAGEIEKHMPAEGKLKCLAFCRNITHARMMCETMGEIENSVTGKPFHTAYLTGKNSIGERIKAYNDLQDDTKDLEILFTVDILNEGVDIPGVNMVLFLRPTESSTIFIQQLGRGLRKYVNKAFVTVLDFIGNSYKRSVQIAFAMGSLAQNFVLEKKLLKDLVRDDFTALGLEPFGVEIHIDDLSKEEIIEYIDQENFNSLNYLKQDYFNFKTYINAEDYPRHMDYLNNDCAPDILKFMSIKIGSRKTTSYYDFLLGINEEKLPVFSDEQREMIKYFSAMLPLVRDTEYRLLELLMSGINDRTELIAGVKAIAVNNTDAELTHAITFLFQSGYVGEDSAGNLSLNVAVDRELTDYLKDLVMYGLTRYGAEYANNEQFVLWKAYRKDQVQLKLCKNPGAMMLGTYYYDGRVYIFSCIKKDASINERLNYMDKFIDKSTFQWESINNISESEKQKLLTSDKAVLFIRKVESEHGIQMPFTYVGEGKMNLVPWPEGHTNERKGLLFHIEMDEDLPDYLQYDFEVG